MKAAIGSAPVATTTFAILLTATRGTGLGTPANAGLRR
jgi:hypothetical protein